MPVDGGAPLSVFESGAILPYLAEKSGKLLSGELRERYITLQWLFWQVGGLGPMLGQNQHFAHSAPQTVPYAIERFQVETQRLYGVLNHRLEASPWSWRRPLQHRRYCRLALGQQPCPTAYRSGGTIRRCITGMSALSSDRRPLKRC